MNITWNIADIKSVYGTEKTSKVSIDIAQTSNASKKVTWGVEDINDVYGTEKASKASIDTTQTSSTSKKVTWGVEDIKDVYINDAQEAGSSKNPTSGNSLDVVG